MDRLGRLGRVRRSLRRNGTGTTRSRDVGGSRDVASVVSVEMASGRGTSGLRLPVDASWSFLLALLWIVYRWTQGQVILPLDSLVWIV